jgi:uncharacterized protein (TIGR00251 family)
MIDLVEHPRGVILSVRAHAASRKNAILGERDGMLRVAVTAAPEKGKANKAIVDVLSKALDVPKSSIELVAGEISPQKRFLIAGVSVDDLRTKLAVLTD